MGKSKELHKKSKYADPSPYPAIRVQAPNLYYAELLMDDYAGLVSELTAINQYFYHYAVTEAVNKKVAELLEHISITEMKHLEMLAKTIILLGGNPVYRGSYSTRNNFWNGSFVYYGCNLCDRLRADLDSEYKAVENYQENILVIKDPYVQAILQRIILDECVHIKLFKEAIEKYCIR